LDTERSKSNINKLVPQLDFQRWKIKTLHNIGFRRPPAHITFKADVGGLGVVNLGSLAVIDWPYDYGKTKKIYKLRSLEIGWEVSQCWPA
jgi:hypothetical protein